MCTVTYLPFSNGGFLLTSSRDEKTSRPAAFFPVTYRQDGQLICFPKDPQSAGTWVAASSRLTVCLLNGAFLAHTPRAPYRHSRGLVVLSVFDYASPAAWLAAYNFTGIEPFTLVIVQSGGGNGKQSHPEDHPVERLWEVRWNGQTPHCRHLNPELPQIWSSVTLYSAAIVARRQHWFGNWLREHPAGAFTEAAIRSFHKQAGTGDDVNAIQMNRGNGMQTVSLTTVQHRGAHSGMCYEDLLSNTLHQQQLTTTYEHVVAH